MADFDLDRAGRSALHYAALEDDAAGIEAAVEAGHEVDLADHDGWVPLHFAAQQQALAATRVLLRLGASPDAENSTGNTPLWVATFRSAGQYEVVSLLLSAGADAARANHSGVSPIDLAETMGDQQLRAMLTEGPSS